jgi:hypothetical protein
LSSLKASKLNERTAKFISPAGRLRFAQQQAASHGTNVLFPGYSTRRRSAAGFDSI